MMRRISLFAWVFALAAAAARGEPAHYRSFTLAVEPWGIIDTDRGVGPDFVRFLADQAGFAVTAESWPYLRVIDGMRTGENAINLGIPTPEREKYGIAICSIGSVKVSLLYRAASGAKRDAASSFSGMAVGELRGSRTLDDFDRAVPHKKVLISDMSQGIRMLEAGRLDATICVRPGCGNILDGQGGEVRGLAESRLTEQSLAIYVSRASPLSRDAAAMLRLRLACDSYAGRQEMRRLLAPFH
ncbi:ABC transporter substrate-binding protein [Chromobacterium sp. IIBBL 290-4]|uniref:substrate-binding periplasmic protein n=1 Tax=Chromobacterium sp. IIBBL 290-4 TaxID=2953890 RepID=UPI0020B89AB7|nr:transporter substrate-binding domain-containing protein [Chromobacterium sp. IIBBL 290-4]UTH73391.1 transporter substrate-binding domain-containing protein [Chromobacterium sp. IIBBL 290-4]